MRAAGQEASGVRIVSIINQKGGCGKTTTAINLAGIMARRGYRTLLVDLDPQSHCAAGLAIPEQRIDMDIGDAMLTDPPSAVSPKRLLWRVSRNLDLAPSRMKLAGLEAARGGLADRPDKERRLLAVLESLREEYDLCLIDCSPSIGLLTYNALVAATDVLIPVETSFFALQGATKQVNTIKSLARRLGATGRYWLVGTIHDESSVLSRDLLAELQRRFGARVAPAVIRRDMSLKEASSFGQPIIEYNPESGGSADYGRLADWLAEMTGLAPGTQPMQVADPLPSEPEPVAVDMGSVPGTASEDQRPMLAAGGVGLEGLAAAMASRVDEMAAMAHEMMTRTAVGGSGGSGGVSGLVGAGVAEGSSEAAGLPGGLATVTRMPGTTPLVVVESKPPPTAEAARPLLGVRQTRLGTLFVQPLELGQRVAVAGDFNGWSPHAHPMRRNEEQGVWELCVALPPGRRRYRLVVDGTWMNDPHNAATDPADYDAPVNVVDVPAR